MKTVLSMAATLLVAASLCLPISASAQSPVNSSDAASIVNLCLQIEVIKPENGARTVAELRAQCEAALTSMDTVNTDMAIENIVLGNIAPTRFFRPYKDNYLIFGRMEMDDGSQPFSGEELDTKFELGLTFSLFQGRRNFDFLAPLHVGYSQKSWWNIAEDSAPFREHNYNPEIYWLFDQPERPILGRPPFVDIIGLEHQSNGRDGTQSRSWDRLYAQKEFALLPQLSVGVKIWDILARDLNNDDIRRYMGNGELSLNFRPNDRTNLRWRVRRGSDVDTFSYSFDIYYRRPNVNGAFFIQYHDGYGEALVTYNQKSRSLRGGFYFPLDVFD